MIEIYQTLYTSASTAQERRKRIAEQAEHLVWGDRQGCPVQAGKQLAERGIRAVVGLALVPASVPEVGMTVAVTHGYENLLAAM